MVAVITGIVVTTAIILVIIVVTMAHPLRPRPRTAAAVHPVAAAAVHPLLRLLLGVAAAAAVRLALQAAAAVHPAVVDAIVAGTTGVITVATMVTTKG